MNLQTQYVLSTAVTGVAVTALGLFVFLTNPQNKLNRLWALFNLAIASWAFGQTAYTGATTLVVAYSLVRVTYLVGVIWIPTLYLHFILEYLGKQKRLPLSLAYGFSLMSLGLIWHHHFLPPPVPKFSLNYYPEAGPLYYPFFLIWSAIIIYGVMILFKAMKRESAIARQDSCRLLFYSSCIGYLGGSSNFLPVFNVQLFPYTPYGTYGIPIYVALFAYAMVRHQLLDIRVAITRTGLLLGVYVLVLGIPFIVAWQGRASLELWLGQKWWLVPLGLCTALATAGPFMYAFLRRQAEARLLHEQRRYQRILQHAARGMTQVREVHKLARLIVRVVSRSVRVQHASLFLLDKPHNRYALEASDGPKRLALQSQYGLDPSHDLVRWLIEHQQVLNREDSAADRGQGIEQELTGLNASLIVPGFIERELIGFLVLGPKLSGAGYSQDDLHAFATLAHEAAMALENAQSYEELVRVNKQLKIAYERLVQQERMAAAGEFATGMAHEIKNPLASIKTFAEYLPERYQDPAFRDKFFRIVQSEIDRINTIVRELLDFAKPAPLQLKPTSLSTLLDETLTLLSNHCFKQGVAVVRQFEENGSLIQADQKQLKQVFLNLILNSLEAMPSGGRLQAQVTQEHPETLLVRIADTGCGIQEQSQAKIFDPFFTTKERGMGLGLAIVKGIIERHSGRIAIRSHPGRGTTVELSLPLYQKPH